VWSLTVEPSDPVAWALKVNVPCRRPSSNTVSWETRLVVVVTVYWPSQSPVVLRLAGAEFVTDQLPVRETFDQANAVDNAASASDDL
jgi:hypothetical protein